MRENTYKKYYILYSIIITILLILAITKGFNNVFIYKIHDDSKFIADGFYKRAGILFYNLLIILIVNILSIFIAIKNREMKYRKILLFIIVIISMFIPVRYLYRSGGIAGITEEIYATTLELSIQFTDPIILIVIFYFIGRGIAHLVEKIIKKY